MWLCAAARVQWANGTVESCESKSHWSIQAASRPPETHLGGLGSWRPWERWRIPWKWEIIGCISKYIQDKRDLSGSPDLSAWLDLRILENGSVDQVIDGCHSEAPWEMAGNSCMTGIFCCWSSCGMILPTTIATVCFLGLNPTSGICPSLDRLQ